MKLILYRDIMRRYIEMTTVNIPALPGSNTPKSPHVVKKIAQARKAIAEADRKVREMSISRVK